MMAIPYTTKFLQINNELFCYVIAGQHEKTQNKVSDQDWPVSGGEAQNSSEEPESGDKDILITGHEDGSVKFWSCGGVALTCLATVKTKPYFVGDDLDEPCGKSLLYEYDC